MVVAAAVLVQLTTCRRPSLCDDVRWPVRRAAAVVACEIEGIRFRGCSITAVRTNPGSDRDVNVRQLAGRVRIDQTGENDQLQASDQDQNQHGREVKPFNESL